MTPRERNMAAIDYIAFWHGVSSARDIIGDDRRIHVQRARCDCAVHFRAQGRSLPEIGRILNRHHTTVLNMIANKRHPMKRKANGQFAATANDNDNGAAARDRPGISQAAQAKG
jgi:hypothetical protein